MQCNTDVLQCDAPAVLRLVGDGERDGQWGKTRVVRLSRRTWAELQAPRTDETRRRGLRFPDERGKFLKAGQARRPARGGQRGSGLAALSARLPGTMPRTAGLIWGVCQYRKVQLVDALEHDRVVRDLCDSQQRQRVYDALLRRLASTTPRDGQWERSYRALQNAAQSALNDASAS